MASPYSKRLAKLEELLASKLNKPLAYLWRNAGETQEEACVRAGYDPSQIDRIVFYRWQTAQEAKIAPPIQHPLDPIIELGPPDDASDCLHGETATAGVTEIAPQPETKPKQMDLEEMIAAKERYERAIAEREREIVQEKINEAAARFATSIV